MLSNYELYFWWCTVQFLPDLFFWRIRDWFAELLQFYTSSFMHPWKVQQNSEHIFFSCWQMKWLFCALQKFCAPAHIPHLSVSYNSPCYWSSLAVPLLVHKSECHILWKQGIPCFLLPDQLFSLSEQLLTLKWESLSGT